MRPPQNRIPFSNSALYDDEGNILAWDYKSLMNYRSHGLNEFLIETFEACKLVKMKINGVDEKSEISDDDKTNLKPCPFSQHF